MLGRLLPVLLIGSSLLAFYWPRLVGPRFDPFLATAGWLDVLIAVTMFCIGWMLPRDELEQLTRYWPAIVGGTLVQYLSMPTLAWCVCQLLGLEGPLRIGVMIAGCVPGAMASNVLTLLARGNASYSVSLTTIATLLSPLVVPPVLLLTLGETVRFDVRGVFAMLVWSVVVPVLSGYGFSRLVPRAEPLARWIGPLVANFTILWVIAVVVAKNRTGLGGLYLELIVALGLLNLGGYLAGWGGSGFMRLPQRMRRALTLEVGMQNAGLGSVLAAQFFSPEAAVPAALYTFGCMLTGTVLASYWSRRPPAESDAQSSGFTPEHDSA